MLDDDATVLNVDCHHIYEFDRALYTHFIDHPAEVTTLLDSEVQNLAAELAGQSASDFEHILVSALQKHVHRLIVTILTRNETAHTRNFANCVL